RVGEVAGGSSCRLNLPCSNNDGCANFGQCLRQLQTEVACPARYDCHLSSEVEQLLDCWNRLDQVRHWEPFSRMMPSQFRIARPGSSSETVPARETDMKCLRNSTCAAPRSLLCSAFRRLVWRSAIPCSSERVKVTVRVRSYRKIMSVGAAVSHARSKAELPD